MVNDLQLRKRICSFAGIASEDVSRVLNTYSKKYKLYRIKKASGGLRTILHPAPQLKMLQYAILETSLYSFQANLIAMAYVRGLKSPLKVHAEKHSTFRYTLRIDFEDFFPSIHPEDLLTVMHDSYNISDDDKMILSSALFYGKRNPFLPIGSPSSPHVSNIVMRDLDTKFASLAHRLDSDSVITRYADDIYFSTNLKGNCSRFLDEVDTVIANTNSPRLRLNTKKTLFLSKATSRKITGLFIDGLGNVGIGRSRKKVIKSLLYKNSKGDLASREKEKTKGLLAFIKDCEPAYYNKLIVKYGPSVLSV